MQTRADSHDQRRQLAYFEPNKADTVETQEQKPYPAVGPSLIVAT